MRSTVWFVSLLAGLLCPVPGRAFSNTVYTSWLASSTYQRQISLAEQAVLHWTIADGRINLAVAAQATGWAAFGISENGGMRGADMVIFEAEGGRLIDAHALDELMPLPDACQSWTLLNSIVDDGLIIFEATRLLDTEDTQDRALFDDRRSLVQANRVIAAWGDTPQYSFHGPNRARRSIRFFGDDEGDEWSTFADVMNDEAEGSMVLVSNNYAIPARETTYAEFCFLEEDLIARGMPADVELHSIGVQPIVDEQTAPYVHHFVVQGSTDPNSCGGFEIAFAWAPGDLPVALPPTVGGPLGQSGFRSFSLQIHYNNPELVPGLVDNSGIELYWTTQKREFDLGVMQVGDPLLRLMGQPVGDGLTSHDFFCPSECSSLALPQPITVLRETLHMHKSGKRMFNSQIRDDEVLRVATADFFDYDQQGSLNVVQDPYEILPGDSFQTRCYYDSQGEQFGLASQDEMCMAFIFYFPRQLIFGRAPFSCGAGLSFGPFTQCEAEWTREDLVRVEDLERTFGPAPESCPVTPSLAPSLAPSVGIADLTDAPAPPTTDESTKAPSPAVGNSMAAAPSPPTSGAVDLASSVLSSILFMTITMCF